MKNEEHKAFPEYELDEDHPLWCVNEQIKGLLEGLGASEDHEDVLTLLRSTGLPEGTVGRMHRAIACGESKAKSTPPPNSSVKLTPLQALVAKHYENGEFDYITDTDQVDGVGDTLFKFCILEAGDAETHTDLWVMLETAINQLRSLQGELEP